MGAQEGTRPQLWGKVGRPGGLEAEAVSLSSRSCLPQVAPPARTPAWPCLWNPGIWLRGHREQPAAVFWTPGQSSQDLLPTSWMQTLWMDSGPPGRGSGKSAPG